MIHKLLLAFALGVFVNLILPLTTSGMSPSKQVPSSGGQGPGSSGSPPPSPPMPPSGCSDSSCTPMPPSYNPYNSEMVGGYSQCNLPAILKQRHEERLKVLNKSICVTKEEKEKFELLNDDSCGDLKLSKQECDEHKMTLENELKEREIERGKLITVLCRPQPFDDSCDDYIYDD
jgi:hypothetical protein